MLPTIMVIFALVIFALAGFLWQPAAEPYRLRLVATGLFFYMLSLIVGPLLR